MILLLSPISSTRLKLVTYRSSLVSYSHRIGKHWDVPSIETLPPFSCLRPLHIAAGTRANFSVIQLLVDAYPKACAIPDTDGKTPLHLACDSACSLFMGDEGCERDPPSYDVVFAIIKAWPSAVPWEDNDGTSALEYAILSGAPIEVVRLLQAVTKKQAQQVRLTNSRQVSQDFNACQQQHRTAIVSEPSEQEPNTEFDGAASTATSMPTRDGHLSSRRRGVT